MLFSAIRKKLILGSPNFVAGLTVHSVDSKSCQITPFYHIHMLVFSFSRFVSNLYVLVSMSLLQPFSYIKKEVVWLHLITPL